MAKQGRTILFQGDSITDAGRGRGEGYQSLGHGYVNLIAGRLGLDAAEPGHRFINRGVGGDRVSSLYARWNEDAIHLQPDTISILAGVNDAWRIVMRLPEGTTDRFERAYRHLLEETKEVMPHAGLVLCEPFLLPAEIRMDVWDEFRGLIDAYGQITRTLAKQYDAVFVGLQEPFNQAVTRADAEYWLHDGVHPTPAGHELIAREWIQAVQSSRLAITN
ncbi:SGNH/GDSL hydrolase family protein [Paenibacillus methanolicus]|uniref:Lysophospholipase L1-like esterase n=1 Tax=Paenibacillus methanolicus TaxID=582686 RepID=A0A5S5C1S7_9BACL|nr:SGNH/GDSL hydrolase family protein [Paenibacillus methanolicus]TYP73254.1 lysophospholipase L1-like esterase [Paenibacillus methanolicus]